MESLDGRIAYVYGNRVALMSTLAIQGDVARFIDGRAIHVPATNRYYRSVAYGLTMRTALALVTPSGRLHEGAPTNFHGRSVIPIIGRQPGGYVPGNETMYVTAGGNPLPVAAAMKTILIGKQGATSVVLSNWGERVRLPVPSDPISINVVPAAEIAAYGYGLGHYGTFTGSHGYQPPQGVPWAGSPCKPIRLEVEKDVPASVYPQMVKVVDEARRDGIDITLETRHGQWNPRSLYYLAGQRPKTTALVRLSAKTGTPPRLSTGEPEHIAFDYATKLSADGRHDQIRYLNAALWLRAVGGAPLIQRRSIRQLIALTQGVGGTNLPGSAIATSSTTDRFTTDDVAAMLQMSGCVNPPRSVERIPTTKSGQPLKFPSS